MRVWNSWVPRVHLAYDLLGDGKSVIKGGYGRFVNLREVNPEVVAANRNNRATSTWVWRDNNNNRDYDPGEVNLDPNGADFRSIAGVTDAVPNPDEPQPKSDEWSLTFERELLRNVGIRTTAVYARNFDLRRLQELHRPYELYNIPITGPDPGADGRVGTDDDPNRSITYWEYPSALSGASVRRHHARGLAGRADLQDLRSRRHAANVRTDGRRTRPSRSPRPILSSTTGRR